MANLIQRDALEVGDGVRQEFHTPEPFVLDTIVPMMNGVVYNDPWHVVDNTTVFLDDTPGDGDVVSFMYIPA